MVFRGKVVDVERRTVEGFARGRARFASFDGDSSLDIRFQNEHLVAVVDGQVRCTVPDLICVLEDDTAEPITTEGLRYGQRVTVVAISTPDLMRTPKHSPSSGRPASDSTCCSARLRSSSRNTAPSRSVSRLAAVVSGG